MTLAHRDATLLRVLPLVIARNAEHMDRTVLVAMACEQGARAEVGLVVDLASHLAPSRALTLLQEELGPPLETPPTPFFPTQGKYGRQLAELHGLPLARRWGFFLNQGEDSFQDVFTKHLGQVLGKRAGGLPPGRRSGIGG